MELNVVLICISQMTKSVEHFFLYLLVFCTSLEKYLLSLFAHLVFWCLKFVSLIFSDVEHFIDFFSKLPSITKLVKHAGKSRDFLPK
jgi:hypothetical protein